MKKFVAEAPTKKNKMPCVCVREKVSKCEFGWVFECVGAEAPRKESEPGLSILKTQGKGDPTHVQREGDAIPHMKHAFGAFGFQGHVPVHRGSTVQSVDDARHHTWSRK